MYYGIMTINRKKLNTVFTQIINLNNDTIYKKKIDNNGIIYLDLQEKLWNQLVFEITTRFSSTLW